MEELTWKKFEISNHFTTKEQFECLCRKWFQREYFGENDLICLNQKIYGIDMEPKWSRKLESVISFQAIFFSTTAEIYYEIKRLWEKVPIIFEKELNQIFLLSNIDLDKSSALYQDLEIYLSDRNIELISICGDDLINKITQMPSEDIAKFWKTDYEIEIPIRLQEILDRLSLKYAFSSQTMEYGPIRSVYKAYCRNIRIEVLANKYIVDGDHYRFEKVVHVPLIDGKNLKYKEAVWIDKPFGQSGIPSKVSQLRISIIGMNLVKERLLDYKVPNVRGLIYIGVRLEENLNIVFLIGDREVYSETERISLFND